MWASKQILLLKDLQAYCGVIISVFLLLNVGLSVENGGAPERYVSCISVKLCKIS